MVRGLLGWCFTSYLRECKEQGTHNTQLRGEPSGQREGERAQAQRVSRVAGMRGGQRQGQVEELAFIFMTVGIHGRVLGRG